MRQKMILAVLLSLGFIFVTSSVNAGQAEGLEANKEIAVKYVEEILEEGNIDFIVDNYLAPEIEIEFPENFIIPALGTNQVKGKEAHRRAAKAWKSETAHNVDISEVIAEDDKVVVLVYVDRAFKIIEGKERLFNDHPMVFIFKFKDGQIINAKIIFDVLDEIEQMKAKKYN
ncbi:MAG: nuclear transport factor 2 family protein [Candidatus Omnitrophica bacterium]|nr:nuclear transport factor 2 family protein [Candidatus Omnitrophota bacterium]MDD5429664.1 nuclear transport factor 2 family protein [Candidatus Omnitrophota bacterium]